MRVTLADIAAELGLSKATVSLALNGNPRISPETTRMVRDYARRVGYYRNRLAQALTTGHAASIGILVSDSANPFYAEILLGAEEEAISQGYSLMLCNTYRSQENEREKIRMLREQCTDGVVIAPVGNIPNARSKRAPLNLLANDGFPLVVVNRRSGNPEIARITIDDYRAAYRLTNHLLKLGHHRICHIRGLPRIHPVEDRMKGYLGALTDAGIEPDPGLIRRCPLNLEGGYEAMKAILEDNNLQFTAVFAGNDLVALGALRALREAGRRVPDDVAVVGFDDIQAARYAYVSLTSMRVPKKELGVRSIRMLTSLIRKGRLSERTVLLIPELVVRESCGGRRLAKVEENGETREGEIVQAY